MKYFSLNDGITMKLLLQTVVTNQYDLSAKKNVLVIFCGRLGVSLLFRIVELIRVEAVLPKRTNTRFQLLPCFPIHLSHEPVRCSLLRHDDL